MNLHTVIQSAQRLLKSNAPSILTGIGVSGTITTAVLAAKGGFKAQEVLRGQIEHEELGPRIKGKEAGEPWTKKDVFVWKAQKTWRCYIPAVSSGVITIVAIVGANKVSAQRTAAAITAYSMTESAFRDYREQVIKQFGSNKEQGIQNEIAKSKVDAAGEPSSTLVIGSGEVLCCELHTGRYFNASMEKLRRAENEVNDQINHQLYVNLEAFYDLIGLDYTSQSNRMGWDSDYGLMELTFSSVLTPDSKPCLAFSYNYIKPI